MPKIVLETRINAPAELCFDLIRDARLHVETKTEKKGVVGLGQIVTFESKSFGAKQKLTVKVTEFERPRRFVDEMVEGAFQSFKHIHEFFPDKDGVLMRDTILWTAPLGFLGKIADRLFLEKRFKNLVEKRNNRLKEIAENGG